MAKILLVEDNEMNRDMLSRRLERRGYDVIVAVKNPPGGDSLQMLFINELLTRDANQRWNNLIADEPTIKGATSDPKLKDYIGFANQWHPDQNVVVKNWPTWSERHKKEIEPLFGKVWS